MSAVLEARDLDLGYAVRRRPWQAPALRPVLVGASFALGAGETLAVLGPSGSGKSTLARVVLGLVRPAAGRVILEGRDLLALRGADLRRARRAIQPVFQDAGASLDPLQAVLSAVAEPLVAHHILGPPEARARAAGLLEGVGLGPDLHRRRPHALSGGQRQRACIARALALEPRVLVCDEPTSALDGPTRDRILDLLVALQAAQGFACLVVTHDPVVVRRLGARAADLDRGRIVERRPA